MNASEDNNITYISVEPTHKSSNSGGDVLSGGSLDKVRDILFGTQMREYEKRFNRLEERLTKEYAESRDETRKRLDSLEAYIKQEIESLSETFKKQQAARDEALKALTEEQKNQVHVLEQKLNQVDEDLNKSARDLRQQILDQSNNLSDEIRHKFAEMLAAIERETQELRNDKANRSNLAALFAEMALRLKGEH